MKGERWIDWTIQPTNQPTDQPTDHGLICPSHNLETLNTRSYEQLLAATTRRGAPVPGLVSAAMAPYVQSMTSECLSPACTERCGFRGVGNLTVAAEEEGLTGFYVGISGWEYG